MSAPTLAEQVRSIQAGSAGLDRVVDLIHAGRLPEAILRMQECLSAPGAGLPEFYWAGLLCHQMRDYKGATAMLESVLNFDPDFAPALYNAGVAWECQGNSEAAIARYRRAAEHWASSSAAVPPLVNLGGCLYRLGKPDEGRAAHDQALAIDCEADDEALTARSAVRLLRGDYATGFREYESRRRLGQFIAANWRPAFGADWQGQHTRSSVLLYHEQGVGDTIQMLRYAERAAEMSGQPVTLCVQPELVRLVQRSFCGAYFVSSVITREQIDARRSHWHAPLMSMPYLTWSTSETVPPAPYLRSERCPGAGGLTVGICWKGNPQHNNDRDRSAPTFDVLAPLFAALPHVRWVSLQHGVPFPQGEPLKAADFAETADIVAACDVVVTVDTSVAHIAGALGVRTMLMAPTAPEWRWGLGDTTPWYDSVTVYRRRATREWGEMVRRIAADLARLV